MKQLTCEMCGSTELVKEEGFFVCQSCGTKYSVEEAKKMMVEGTVKIDNSEKIENYQNNMKTALKAGDYERAGNYAEMLLAEKADSWSANFYVVYCQAFKARVVDLEINIKRLKKTLDTVLKLLKSSSNDSTELCGGVVEISVSISQLCALYISALEKYVDEVPSSYRSEAIQTYASGLLETLELQLTLGNKIEEFFSDDEKIIKFAVATWKQSTEEIYRRVKDENDTTVKKYVVKIRTYEPEYKLPKLDNVPKPNNVSESNKTTATSSGGCYVATCVYGSYDCPEVWTLRRFRDNTLGATWYGRLFIRTYYAISPTLVKWFGNTSWFKKMWQGTLDRMVEKLQSNGVEDTPYDDKEW